jgi:hypothetical protein
MPDHLVTVLHIGECPAHLARDLGIGKILGDEVVGLVAAQMHRLRIGGKGAKPKHSQEEH